tara:strand:+ start:1125 stop:1265 length:141 start_codon:yes stop_codon:yes gene_type:complete
MKYLEKETLELIQETKEKRKKLLEILKTSGTKKKPIKQNLHHKKAS